MAFHSIFERLSGARTVDEGVIHEVIQAQPIGPSAKELLVKDLLPELERATDIKQRIETVRAKPTSTTNAAIQRYSTASAVGTNQAFSNIYNATRTQQSSIHQQQLQQASAFQGRRQP